LTAITGGKRQEVVEQELTIMGSSTRTKESTAASTIPRAPAMVMTQTRTTGRREPTTYEAAETVPGVA